MRVYCVTTNLIQFLSQSNTRKFTCSLIAIHRVCYRLHLLRHLYICTSFHRLYLLWCTLPMIISFFDIIRTILRVNAFILNQLFIYFPSPNFSKFFICLICTEVVYFIYFPKSMILTFNALHD